METVGVHTARNIGYVDIAMEFLMKLLATGTKTVFKDGFEQEVTKGLPEDARAAFVRDLECGTTIRLFFESKEMPLVFDGGEVEEVNVVLHSTPARVSAGD